MSLPTLYNSCHNVHPDPSHHVPLGPVLTFVLPVMPTILANPNSNIEKTYCLSITSLSIYRMARSLASKRLKGPNIASQSATYCTLPLGK